MIWFWAAAACLCYGLLLWQWWIARQSQDLIRRLLEQNRLFLGWYLESQENLLRSLKTSSKAIEQRDYWMRQAGVEPPTMESESENVH